MPWENNVECIHPADGSRWIGDRYTPDGQFDGGMQYNFHRKLGTNEQLNAPTPTLTEHERLRLSVEQQKAKVDERQAEITKFLVSDESFLHPEARREMAFHAGLAFPEREVK